MRTGRLAISRGFSAPEPQGEPARFAPPPLAEAPPNEARRAEPTLGEALALVNVRLEALERREAGALTADEFLAEKAAILGHGPSNLAGPRAPDAPPIGFRPAHRDAPRGRSLAGRLGWMLIPAGLVAGLGLSAISQPDATARAWDEALRMIGA